MTTTTRTTTASPAERRAYRAIRAATLATRPELAADAFDREAEAEAENYAIDSGERTAADWVNELLASGGVTSRLPMDGRHWVEGARRAARSFANYTSSHDEHVARREAEAASLACYYTTAQRGA